MESFMLETIATVCIVLFAIPCGLFAKGMYRLLKSLDGE